MYTNDFHGIVPIGGSAPASISPSSGWGAGPYGISWNSFVDGGLFPTVYLIDSSPVVCCPYNTGGTYATVWDWNPAFQQYTNDYKRSGSPVSDVLVPWLQQKINTGYGASWNYYQGEFVGVRLGKVPQPDNYILMCDSATLNTGWSVWAYNPVGASSVTNAAAYQNPAGGGGFQSGVWLGHGNQRNHTGQVANALFADWHAESCNTGTLGNVSNYNPYVDQLLRHGLHRLRYTVMLNPMIDRSIE